MDILVEIGIIITVTTLIAGMAQILRQPLIIGYIFSGIIVGPYFLNVIHSTGTISTFSQMGIALLLFIVGLNLSPQVIKEVGKVSSVTGVGQVIFTSLIGFFICRMLDFSVASSVYIAVALTFSSTIIIMKLLSDKGDIGTLYGRISIGFLIIQDLIAIFALMMISSLASGFGFSTLLYGMVLKGFGMLGVLLFAAVYILPHVTKIIAKSSEFLLLFSVAWCFAVSSLFYYLGFSVEAGALLAGISLSLSPYRYEISSRMRPLRDFFIVLFFILLGSQMVFTNMYQYIPAIIVLSLFILIGNPLIVMALMGMLGYTRRNSFLAGLTVAQISEFSLILVAMGVAMGHLTNEILSIVTVIGLITIAGSTYMIVYANRIYPCISKYLKIFEKRGSKVDEHKYHSDDAYDIILFGYNRIGYDLLETFEKIKKKFLIVDYNPEKIIDLAKEGVDCRYGDAGDTELLGELNLSKAKMIYSTIPDFDTNILLINKVREVSKDAIIIVVSHQINEAMELYDKGASYVILPHFLGGYHAATMIEKYGLDFNKFVGEKITHIEHLKKRKERGHEHPKHNGRG